VEAGGYHTEAYWTPEGWAWRNGADADLSLLNEFGDDAQRYKDWITGREKNRRGQPYFWQDSQWGAPTRPVVGVCWHEALAYCRWLTEQLRAQGKFTVFEQGTVAWPEKAVVVLPSEAEWEKAARGPQARRWAWGNDFQAQRANTKEGELGETSPVGMYPSGASPYQVLDMTGNVWEWTRSRWGRKSLRRPDYTYPYHTDDGREALDGPDARVLRGGSWLIEARGARSAYRYRLMPVYYGASGGFRCVVSLAFSGREA
jgi:formylglycine-generating enzyme required for sulfatase activity